MLFFNRNTSTIFGNHGNDRLVTIASILVSFIYGGGHYSVCIMNYLLTRHFYCIAVFDLYKLLTR